MHHVIIDPRKLRAVALMAPKDEIRYYLKGVHIEITPDEVFYVATNGHALICYRDARPDNCEPYAPGSLIVPRDVARSVKPVNRHVVGATLEYGGEMATLSNLKGADLTFKPIDGKFPDWRRVIPLTCDGTPAHFNPELLAIFSAIARELANNKGAIPPTMLTPNGDGCALVAWTDNPRDYVAAIMPWRNRGSAVTAPAWVQPELPAASQKAA